MAILSCILTHTDEVVGDDMGVTGVRIKDTQSEKIDHVDVMGAFIAIGHEPNTAMFQNQLEMKNGYIVVQSGIEGNATQTSIPYICRR